MTTDPGAPAHAIAILGKSQGTKPENRQLAARVGLAAALWHDAAPPKPLVLYVAAHDVPAVEAMLVRRYLVPPDRIATRWSSNCTFVEVRQLRDLAEARGVDRIVAVTHPYHARRTRAYLHEVFPGASVVPVEAGALSGLTLPDVPAFAALPGLIDASQPTPLDSARERLVEEAMRAIHAVDRGGRLECGLANLVRVPHRRPR